MDIINHKHTFKIEDEVVEITINYKNGRWSSERTKGVTGMNSHSGGEYGCLQEYIAEQERQHRYAYNFFKYGYNKKENTVKPIICLQVGMKVKIKNDVSNYSFNAGKIKTITAYLPDFGKSRAFALDNDTGTWCIQDFEYCVDYPDMVMS